MKPKSIDSGRIDDYFGAVSNEAAIDTHAYKLYGLDPAAGGHLPRPMKWVTRYKQLLPMIRIAALAMRLIWIMGGGIAFFFKELLAFRSYMKASCSVKRERKPFDKYGLAFSARAVNLIRPSNIEYAPNTWVTFPWVASPSRLKDCQTLNIITLLSGKDLWKAFSLSIAAVYNMVADKDLRPWLLQSYTAFRWFATQLGLEKLEGEFYIAEHYDRWAVLMDSVVYRKNSSIAHQCVLHLVQHGSLSALEDTLAEPGLAFALKYKLKAVSSLYIYDAVSGEIFNKDILDASPSRPIDIHYYSPGIELGDDIASRCFSILFVGHPICELTHIAIYRKIQEKYPDVVFCYKPHPTALPSEKIKRQRWTVIEDSQYFPAVNLIISYPSTLVAEYSLHDIPAVIHAIDISVDQLGPVLENIERFLPVVKQTAN